jgi:hypothetical protein
MHGVGGAGADFPGARQEGWTMMMNLTCQPLETVERRNTAIYLRRNMFNA